MGKTMTQIERTVLSLIPVTDEARREGVLPLKAQAIKEFKRVNKIQKGNLDEWKKYLGD